jgi:predicted amidohydrolase YtcJ
MSDGKSSSHRRSENDPVRAISGERIVALGDDRQIDHLAGPKTRVIDLKGRLVVPGFVESHGHLQAIGRGKLELNLVGTK